GRCPNLTEESEESFGEESRRRLVEEFTVSYYNGSLKPNLAEKNPINGRDIEYLMDGPQFDRTRRSDIWSYGSAIGTGYQYKVVYKDRRFSDLERLMQVYSGTLPGAEADRALAEQRLYETIMLMIKEGRLPKTFRIQSKGAQEEKLLAMIEELGRSMEELGRRVKELEEKLVARDEPRLQSPPSQGPHDALE
ncbi:MAG TPA: hypothetical protein VLX33_01790, partial [Nitrososphaerales archaeon]|nr:hypothetical protein [Nitrososphaerales archaeon]